jgi:hypothetical protein
VLRVVRGASGQHRRYLLTNRSTCTDRFSSAHSTTGGGAARLAVALEHAESARKVAVQELAPVTAHLSTAPGAAELGGAGGGGGAHASAAGVLGLGRDRDGMQRFGLAARQHAADEEAARRMRAAEGVWDEASEVVENVFRLLQARGSEGAWLMRTFVARAEDSILRRASSIERTPSLLSRVASGDGAGRAQGNVQGSTGGVQAGGDAAGGRGGVVGGAGPGVGGGGGWGGDAREEGPLEPVKVAVDFMRDADGNLVLLQVKDVVWGQTRKEN